MNICDVSLVLSQFNFETLQSRLNLLKFIERLSIKAGTQRITERTDKRYFIFIEAVQVTQFYTIFFRMIRSEGEQSSIKMMAQS